MITDPIANALTRVRNAQRSGHRSVSLPKAKVVAHILEVLKSEGFVSSVETKKVEGQKFESLEVGLKYFSTGEPAITTLKRVSSPGRRVYASVDKLPKVRSGLGISILSTSAGVCSDREARKRGLGGEIIAQVG